MVISKDLAKLIGIQLGDGCISITDRYHECAISGDINEEKEYYDEIIIPLYNKLVFYPILNKKLNAKEYKKNGTYGILVFNRQVVEFFLNKEIKSGSKLDAEVPSFIIKNKRLWIPFLRGLFDTDGSIYFNKNYAVKESKRKHNRPRIKLGMTSKKIIFQVNFMLKKLGFNTYLKPPYKGKRDKNPVYSIMIQRKEDIQKFINKIGFESTKHKTKWEIFQKLGYCPPKTTLKERYKLLIESKPL